MKIRINQPGYESFDGQLGDVQFAAGESVTDVSAQQAAFVRSIVGVEEVEGAEQGTDSLPSGAQDDALAAAAAEEAARLAAIAQRELDEAVAAANAAQQAADRADALAHAGE